METEAKPFWKSMTLWGALASFVGAVELIMQDPTILQPFIDLGLLTVPGAHTVGAIFAAGGALLAAWGRIRPSGGVPLTPGTPPSK